MDRQQLKFHACVVDESGEPRLHSFQTLQGLGDFVRGLPTQARGFLFHGSRLHVTAGEFRFLVFGDEKLPLFTPPKLGKLDQSAGLGRVGQVSPEDPLYTELVGELDLTPVEAEGEEEEGDSEEPPEEQPAESTM